MRAAAALSLSLLAACAAEDGEVPLAPSQLTPPGPGPASDATTVRWKRLGIGPRATQRMTMQVDARGNTVHSCAGDLAGEVSSK